MDSLIEGIGDCPFLVRVGQWLTYFEPANPWKHPQWAWQDVQLITRWLAEDYLYCSPVFLVMFGLFWVVFFYFLASNARRIRRSYMEYLALGRGAQPSNVIGWLKNELWQVLLLDILGLDVLSRPYVNPYAEPCIGQLFRLPELGRPRPQIKGLGPLKQETDSNPSAVLSGMQGFRNWVLRNMQDYKFELSSRTGHPTLMRNLIPQRESATLNTWAEWGGEIAHVHPDGSLSIFLHPWDAAEVIERGWGQRNPLAIMNEVWLWRFFWHWVYGTRTPLPSSEVIVYAPLNEQELDTVVQMLMAGMWFAMGCPPDWPQPQEEEG